jgi:hypothetical protein
VGRALTIAVLSMIGIASAFAVHAQDRRRPSDPIPRIPARPLSVQEQAQRAADEAMNDPTLRRGDIVSTGRGLLQFEGAPQADRRAQDFVPVRP